MKKNYKKLSNCGDGPEDPYLVRDPLTGELQTGCFVLRPTLELEAYLTLKNFVNLLIKHHPEDERIESLVKWVRRLDKLWK